MKFAPTLTHLKSRAKADVRALRAKKGVKAAIKRGAKAGGELVGDRGNPAGRGR